MLMLLMSSRGLRIIEVPEPSPLTMQVPVFKPLKLRLEDPAPVDIVYREFVRVDAWTYVERETVGA